MRSSAAGPTDGAQYRAGRRNWLNPYLGLRGGYARLRGRNGIAAGGSVGVELLQTKVLTLEPDGRFYGLFGTSARRRARTSPSSPALGANVAF